MCLCQQQQNLVGLPASARLSKGKHRMTMVAFVGLSYSAVASCWIDTYTSIQRPCYETYNILFRAFVMQCFVTPTMNQLVIHINSFHKLILECKHRPRAALIYYYKTLQNALNGILIYYSPKRASRISRSLRSGYVSKYRLYFRVDTYLFT